MTAFDPDIIAKCPAPTHDSPMAVATRYSYPYNGYCLRCGFPFRIVQEHVTVISRTDEPGHVAEKELHPLCESCWQLLGSPEARIEYYASVVKMLVDMGMEVTTEDRANVTRAVANGG